MDLRQTLVPMTSPNHDFFAESCLPRAMRAMKSMTILILLWREYASMEARATALTKAVRVLRGDRFSKHILHACVNQALTKAIGTPVAWNDA